MQKHPWGGSGVAWGARCACGVWLTKWDFTEDDARACAEDAISRTDRWRHECEHTRQPQLALEV